MILIGPVTVPDVVLWNFIYGEVRISAEKAW